MDIVLVLLTVPTVTAFIGYLTNWLAVKMIFEPQRFIGVGPIGWQGILPSKSDKFAGNLADTATDKFISARELAERLDPEEMEALFEERLADEAPALVREAAEVVRPGMWDEIVPDAQAMIVQQISQETQSAARDLFDRLQGVSDELLDLRALIHGLLSGENVDRLVRLFQEMGKRELTFIARSGAYFGFAIGLAQAAAFTIFNQWWLMPVVGGLVGLGTNFLAIQMIFRPQEPKRYLGFTYQGLYAARQAEIARDYGRVSADEIFTPNNLLRLITEGESGDNISRLVLEEVGTRIDAQRPMLEAIVQQPITDEQIERVKLLLVDRVTAAIPEIQPELEGYLERKLDVGGLIQSKISALPKDDFETMFRQIFQEDEITLIVLGGALGAAVGLLQGAVVLAANL